MIFWQLFVSYLKIGFFGFGGGYAMLSLIQNEVVVQHAWMTNAEFADIVAISQSPPGPSPSTRPPMSATRSAHRPATRGAASWVRRWRRLPYACRRSR